MSGSQFVHPDEIRMQFARGMSELYRAEIPIYQDLVELVAKNNDDVLRADSALNTQIEQQGGLIQLGLERHGAIRLGTASELRMVRKVFALMGMSPVGYYDLSQAGIPVHSTAFRPITLASIQKSPFRIFTSMLRPELIEDEALRATVHEVLSQRDIFTPGALDHVQRAEKEGGIRPENFASFLAEVLPTFRWHQRANVDFELYERLHHQHRLIADIVCFHGPHINHLTPASLDIDAVQSLMSENNLRAKAIVEGPPLRKCPILLRQTAFTAVSENVSFPNADGSVHDGSHTARFGEVEQRGLALTPKGHALYEKLLQSVMAQISPSPDGQNAQEYYDVLAQVFEEFPDSWDEIQEQELGYFTRAESGALVPILYEDFLPVSAAGIFRSNLGTRPSSNFKGISQQQNFEKALGCQVIDPFKLYAEISIS